MIPCSKNHPVEGVFVLAMFVLCATLGVLQYRWTGELARAEVARLQVNLDEQAKRITRLFDAELTESASQLRPFVAEIEARGRAAVHAERLRNWQASHPRPIFRRIGIVVPRDGMLQLSLLDQTSGALTGSAWPSGWNDLHENLKLKFAGTSSPRYRDQGGLIFEFPVWARDGWESEWVILELDRDYLCEKWLPDLIRGHLNFEGKLLNDVEISSDRGSIYLEGTPPDRRDKKTVQVAFNLQARADEGRGPRIEPLWHLTARSRPGALEAIVDSARRRNVAVALVLNILILAAGLALLRHTRRTRALAETRLNFVANVSHELRTPLTVIRGAAHNLERGVVRDPERIAQYSALISQHAGHLQEMVEQVLELAGAQKNLPALARGEISISEILRDAVAASAPETSAAQCAVELHISEALPSMTGDASALRRAFQNLLVNAAKHGGAGGWIGVTAVVTNGSKPPAIEVEIADCGPGIPSDEHVSIFEPFVRGAAAQEAQTRGSGLGLSLVREIVASHGGGVSLRSEVGRGAAFTVSLPVS